MQSMGSDEGPLLPRSEMAITSEGVGALVLARGHRRRSLEGTNASDERLMRAVQADEPLALDRLYHRHSACALRVARSVCRDDNRAEDAVQDAFLSVWRGRAGYHSTGSFKGWLMRTVRNRALDSLRNDAAQKRPPAARRDHFHDRGPGSRSALDEVIAQNESDALRASLERLPQAQSEVVALAFFDGLSHLEIAERLELPEGTVKGRMRLGLKKMRMHSPRGSL